jgi:hypothetical protein
MAKTKDRVADAKPYVQRALKDDALRDDLKNAFAAAREVYDELLGGRGATRMATRVATDKEIQDNLRTAIDDLRSAANRLQGESTHKSRGGLLFAGIVLGILFNPMTGPDTRKWIKDKILGDGDEFGYDGGNSNK